MEKDKPFSYSVWIKYTDGHLAKHKDVVTSGRTSDDYLEVYFLNRRELYIPMRYVLWYEKRPAGLEDE